MSELSKANDLTETERITLHNALELAGRFDSSEPLSARDEWLDDIARYPGHYGSELLIAFKRACLELDYERRVV